MKREIKTSLDFLRIKADQKVSFGQGVIASLTDNKVLFPNLPVELSDLQKANDDLFDANGSVQSKATVARSRQENVELVWNRLFKKEANYVTTVADGDAEIIEKAGFKATKAETTPTAINGVPSDFSVVIEKGSKGSFIASCKAEVKTSAYVFIAIEPDMEVAQNGDTLIISMGGKTAYIKVENRKETLFTNVVSKKTLLTTVYSVNSAGSSAAAPSQEITPQ